MKNPEKYISELLEIHDCVVIPDFGGFVLNETSSMFVDGDHKLNPPIKKPSFNRNLCINDGLLANYMTQEDGLTYFEAISEIKKQVEYWKKRLSDNESVYFDRVGSLSMNNEQKILFEPDITKNFLKSSFGLSTIVLTPIEKQNTPKIFALPTNRESDFNQGNWVLRKVIPFSAVAASLIFAIFVFFNSGLIKNPSLAIFRSRPLNTGSVIKSIQPIAASIGNIIDESTAKPVQNKVEDSVSIPNPKYYVVGGSFKIQANAEKFLSQLKEKGYKAELLNNEDGWFRVSYFNEQDSIKADKDLHSIKINENQSAWVLKF